jgi:FkbM family methyltransferase
MFPYLGINCVFDVGARYGEYGTFLRQNGYQGHIISFEPVSSNFERLSRCCANDPKWRAFQYALGSENTVAEINVAKLSNYSSFLQPTARTVRIAAGSTIESTEEVVVRRLDDVFDDLLAEIDEPRIYLKMDTQGWDLEVLRGADGCLDRVAALQSEMSVNPLYEGTVELREALAEFNQAGFAVTGFFNLPHHDGFRLSELDCVMVRTARDRETVIGRW